MLRSLIVLIGCVAALAPLEAQTLVRTFGGTGTGNGEFREINGLAFDDEDNLYVLDALNARVQVFDADGLFVRSFGSFGTGPGQFDEPCGIAVSSFWRRVFVSEGLPGTLHHRIQVFDLDGTFRTAFGVEGSGDGELSRPCQVAVFGPSGSLFVADSGNSRVQEFDIEGNFRGVIGGPGTGDGEFSAPFGIVGFNVDAFVGTQQFYVSDSFDNRVQAFDVDGTFLFEFGDLGSGEGEFDRPCQLAGYGNELGFLYVTDGRNQRVQLFDRDGIYHAEIPLAVAGPSQFCSLVPLAVAVDSRGLVYVEEDNFIKVFSMDRDGDGLLDTWETDGFDADNDGIVDLDLPNIAGPGVGVDPDHKDLFLELDWEVGVEPNQAAVHAMKTAFAFAPVDAGGVANPDGAPGIRLWVDTGGLTVAQVSEDGAGPGSCTDGIDNAAEGPGAAPGTCSDGIDNDLDGFIDGIDTSCDGADAVDSTCSGIEDGTVEGSCFDGIDNGGDGLADSADEDCLVGDDLSRESGAAAGSCRDGSDNDGDSLVDANDPDCSRGGSALFNPVANESGGANDMSCSDGADNNGDGLIDGLDPNCALSPLTGGVRGLFYIAKHGTEALPVEDGAGPNSCFDGVDNGGMDGADGRDRDCTSTCFDGQENDTDGLVDAADPNCAVGGNFDRDVRKLIFRYGATVSGGGGQGERGGNDFVTANGGDGGTMMHEFGHNLNLAHGGDDDVNRKPNYVSVMDYDEQFCIFPRGSTRGCARTQRRLLDFSPARWGGSEGTFAAANVCFDGVDNDLDGLVDADDPECHLDLQRAAAPLADLIENSIDESNAFDMTDQGHSVIFHDASGNARLWNADADIDGDGSSDGVDWLADGAPFTASGLTVDSNRDGICVCAGADLTLETAMTGGDDVPFPPGIPGCPGFAASIRNGLNQTCETTAAATDTQVRTEGNAGAGSCTDGVDNDSDGATDGADEECFEPMILMGYDDWSNIRMDFRQYDDSLVSADSRVVIIDPLNLRDFEDQLRQLNTADLSVDLTASPIPVEVGDDVTFHLDVVNNGPNPTINVSAKSVADVSTPLALVPSDCLVEGTTDVSCDIDVLGLGETRRFDVTVTTGVCEAGLPSPVTHRGSVMNTSGLDPDLSNNEAGLTITPVDTTPPTITSLSATPSLLWPPNHRMVPVEIRASASDFCTSAPGCRISEVTSNEAVLGKGAGKTSPDWVVTGDLALQLRAERAGKGSGRAYSITVECADASGNATSETTTVLVPHNR